MMDADQRPDDKADKPQKKTLVYKLVLLGDVYVGKTSIAYRFAKGEFSDFQESTVGAVFMTHGIELPDAMIKFDMWDTAGQERYRSLAPMYYKGAKAAVVVYDITSYETFKRAKEWIEELRQNASQGITIALVGNKLDLEENRAVQTTEAKEYADKYGLLHFETSAKRNVNLSEVFLAIAKKIPEKTPNPANDAMKIDQVKPEKKGYGCCGSS